MNKTRKNATLATVKKTSSPEVSRTKIVRRPKVTFQESERGCYAFSKHNMTEAEYQRYVATCEQSYDIMKETFALYTLHPNALYVI